MLIKFIGNSKEERNRARAVAVSYLLNHPDIKSVVVHKTKWNYHKNINETVVAGHVYRSDDGSFYWSPFDDKSSGTNINRYGESTDPIWWYQIRKSAGGKTIDSLKALTEARERATYLMQKEGFKNLYITKSGSDVLGIVSQDRNRVGGFVWITFKNPRDPIKIDAQYVLKADGTLGRRL